MPDDTHVWSTVVDRAEPVDAPHAPRPRIDVGDPGPAETAWRAAIDRRALRARDLEALGRALPTEAS